MYGRHWITGYGIAVFTTIAALRVCYLNITSPNPLISSMFFTWWQKHYPSFTPGQFVLYLPRSMITGYSLLQMKSKTWTPNSCSFEADTLIYDNSGSQRRNYIKDTCLHKVKSNEPGIEPLALSSPKNVKSRYGKRQQIAMYINICQCKQQYQESTA